MKVNKLNIYMMTEYEYIKWFIHNIWDEAQYTANTEWISKYKKYLYTLFTIYT